MAQVNISNVVKRFGAHQILGGVSLDIDDGEFAVLVGPSGCGKSTLLRMIAGLEDISGGTVSIGSKIVNDLAPNRRDIAMVFQNYALYPHMTVEQNMAFSLRINGMPKPEQQRRVSEAANILGLSSLLNRLPKQLSGGQRQRVAMGRAIVRKPEVFLFDEPLSNLDAKLRVVMRAEIKSLHQRFRTTTIYVTHDQVEAMTMADKIVVMNQGHIEQVGTPLDLYNQPCNLFVAGFIGSPSMNFIDGTITNAHATSITLDDALTLPIGPDSSWTPGQRVTYGIRPEHVTIDRAAGILAEVRLVEPMGSETQLMVSLGRHPLTVLVRDQISLRVGQRIHVSPIAERAMLFDATSTHRLPTGA